MAENERTSEVVDLIHLLCQLCQKRNKLMFKKLNIKDDEFSFFMSVKNLNKLNILQMANSMDLPQAKVSRIIEKLVKRGFLIKKTPTDKRGVVVAFTNKGKEMYELAHDNKCLGNEALRNILKEDGYQEFKDLLNQIVENYEL